jgi:hypothetical protein
MNKYLVTLRIHGQLVKTALFAESAVHARLICEYQFGMGSVSVGPTRITSEAQHYPLLDEITAPTPQTRTPKPPQPPKITTTPPKTPDQMRIAQLKANVDRQKDALRRERENQKRQREAEHRWRNLGGI